MGAGVTATRPATLMECTEAVACVQHWLHGNENGAATRIRKITHIKSS